MDRHTTKATHSNKGDMYKEEYINPPGNTIPPVDKNKTNTTSQLYRWCFTLKCTDDPNELKSLGSILNEYCKEWYFQIELSEKQYKHFQGCFSLKTKERFHTVKNIIGRNDVHLESVKDWNAAKKYCQKVDTRLLGPFNHKNYFNMTPHELYPWQEELINLVSKPPTSDRHIYWFYDRKGNVGKTYICKYLVSLYSANYCTNGSSKDIAYALQNDPKIVLFDFSRSIEGRLNYSILEQVKNGLVFSGKYESLTKVFDSPHVICMANFPPDLTQLSVDRWVLINLTDEEDIHSLDYGINYVNTTFLGFSQQA